MAATAVSAVLSKFGELALSEGKLLVQVGDKMMLLRDRLEWLQAFIRDADRKRRAGTDGLSRVWLRQTRDVAFQVEDALDEFFHQVDLESQGYQGWQKWGRYLSGCWTQVTVRHVLSGRLDKIYSRLEQISKNQKEYKIEHTPLVTLASSTANGAAWRDEREDMLGFDEDLKSLEAILLRGDHPETRFISIIGESGVGKTALADALFNKIPLNDSKETKYIGFIEPDSWPEEVVQVYYNAMSKAVEGFGKSGEEDADRAAELHAYLSDKKYVVFLGGITSKVMLNLVRKCLPDNKYGSSVVLVLDAENEEVALHADSMNQDDGIKGIHLVTRLDEKRSGELFRCKALRREEEAFYRKEGNKKNYDEMVFGITGGHRLSIVLLAGLLRMKERPLQWELVLQQLLPPSSGIGSAAAAAAANSGKVCEVEQQKTATTNQQQLPTSIAPSVERIFWACFEDLPNDIKSCFLYFVVNGKATGVVAEVIIWMWIGEGFIKPHKGMTMEEVGWRYIKELALRCLIQVDAHDDLTGRIGIVKVHGLVHDFLLSEVREAGFAEIHDVHHVFVPPSARRLSFQIYGGRYSTITNKLPKLRSFISMGKGELEDEKSWTRDSTGASKGIYDLNFLLGSRFLRVLVLGGERVKELPKEFGNVLLELRFICIRSKELVQLPSSIKRLLNLQTLAINVTGVERIDPGFWKITTLRHVVADKLTLPESLHELEEMNELQTLSGVKPPQGVTWNVDTCPLRKMTKLRTLRLEGIQHHHHRAALEAALKQMHLLVSVTLVGDLLPTCVFTAKNLRFLEVVRLGGMVDWPADGGSLNARMLRPNLRRISVDPIQQVPAHIREEMEYMLSNKA